MPDQNSHRAPLSRRAVVAGAGAATIGAGLLIAGCGSPDKPGAATRSTPAPPGTVLGPAADVPVGGGEIYPEQGVVVTQPVAGRFDAFSAVCPHQGCKVNSVREGQIVCPCHGSRFGLDGSLQTGPATHGLDPLAVTVQDGRLTLS